MRFSWRSPLLMATPPQVPPLVTPRSAADIPRKRTNCKAGGQGVSLQLWSLLGAQRRTGGNTPHPSLAAFPGDGCHTFTVSILLPYDSAPWAPFTGQPNKNLCLEGWVLCLTHTQHTLHRWSSCPWSFCKPQKLPKITELHTTWMSQADSA